MIVFLIIFSIVIAIQIIIICLLSSKIVLSIEECDISYNEKFEKKINIKNLKVSVKVYILRKIKVLNIKIHKDYCEILKMKIKFNLLKSLKDDKENGAFYIIKNIEKLKPEIKNINLELNIGTQSMMVTTFLVPIISTFFSIFISKHMRKNDDLNKDNQSKYNLKILPRHLNTNNFILKASGQIYFDTLSTLFFIKKHKEIKV